MFDFNNFIEIINDHSSMTQIVDKALDSIKDDFHIGKIEAVSISNPEVLEKVCYEDYDKNPFRLPRKHLPIRYGGIHNEGIGEVQRS